MVRVASCISMVLGFTSSAMGKQACKEGHCEEVEEVGLLQHGKRFGPLPHECITPKDMDATIGAFMGAVEAIGKEAGNCTAAKEAAVGALDAAYAYHVPDVTVLFKPTLTVPPHVYRPTKSGALSYFVGTCVCPGATVPLSEAPEGCGLAQGYYAPDTGFAFGASPGFKGWTKVEPGGEKRGGKPGTNFWYNHGGRFCHAAVAQGPVCFTAGEDGSVTCVDKTFGFVPNPDKSAGALRAVLSTHHSSAGLSAPSTAGY